LLRSVRHTCGAIDTSAGHSTVLRSVRHLCGGARRFCGAFTASAGRGAREAVLADLCARTRARTTYGGSCAEPFMRCPGRRPLAESRVSAGGTEHAVGPEPVESAARAGRLRSRGLLPSL